MTTSDDVHHRTAPSAREVPAASGVPAEPGGDEDPVAALRRVMADGVDPEPRQSAAAGGPLRAWEAVRSGRWATTPQAALGVGLVALLVCVVVLVRAQLLAPEPVAADAGQRVAIAATTAGDGSGADGGDPVAEGEPVSSESAPSGDALSGAPTADTPTADAAGAAGGGPTAAGGVGVLVHVVGQVRAPGVVEVAPGARVADAVAAAGGFTGEADAAALNLARAVVDGEQIVVTRPGEAPAAAPAAAPPAGSAPTAGASGTAGSAGGLVPLDTATATELDALPGIGPVLAQRIVEWREANGGFTSTDELGEVSGIGDNILEQLRPLVVA